MLPEARDEVFSRIFFFLEKGNKLFRSCSRPGLVPATLAHVQSPDPGGACKATGAGRSAAWRLLTVSMGHRSWRSWGRVGGGMGALHLCHRPACGARWGVSRGREAEGRRSQRGCCALVRWRANGTKSKKGRASWPLEKGAGRGRASARPGQDRGSPRRQLGALSLQS